MGAALGKGKIHFPEKRKADPGTRGKASPKVGKSYRNRAQKLLGEGTGTEKAGSGPGKQGKPEVL